jgi:heme exporter protein D
MDRIFFAGLLGGVAMFIWVYVSWTLLPLGSLGLRKLPNETAVLDALQKNLAENSGIYLFPEIWLEPNPPVKDFAEKVARYPSGILMYNAAGSRPVAISHWLVVDFLTDLAEALLAVFLLSQTRLVTFGARLTFVLLVGILAASATNVGYWNWYGFPLNYTLALIFTQVVGFFWIGLIAAFVLKGQAFGVTSAEGLLRRMWRAMLGG